MKNILKILFLSVIGLSLSGCYGYGFKGNPAAIQAGASIGGVLGSVIGDRSGGYNGSQFGAIMGTVAGAVIGNAATTPRQRDNSTNRDNEYSDNNYSQKNRQKVYADANSNILISNIRFVNSDDDLVIKRGEECKLIFEIENAGALAVYNVTPIINEISGNKNIYISTPIQIAYLKSGDKVRYTAVIKGGNRLKNGKANFELYTLNSDGEKSETMTFSLTTAK